MPKRDELAERRGLASILGVAASVIQGEPEASRLPEKHSPEVKSGEKISPEKASRESYSGEEYSPQDLTSGYYKTDNEIDDILIPTLPLAQQSIYRYLYRHSWGWGRNWCYASIEEIAKGCNITTRAVMTNIKSLLAIGYIGILEEHTRNNARKYRVYIPAEIPSLRERSSREKKSPEINSPEDKSHEGNSPLYLNEIHLNDEFNSRELNSHEARNPDISWSPRPAAGPIKYNTKDIYKNNNKERLLLFFSNTPFEPITPEALEWLSQHDYETVVDYARKVLAWPGTKNPMALLRAALANKYQFQSNDSESDPSRDEEIKAAIEQQAKRLEAEEEAFRAFKESLPKEERDKIAARALESLSSDSFYAVIQGEEIRRKYVDGKIEAEMRREFLKWETSGSSIDGGS